MSPDVVGGKANDGHRHSQHPADFHVLTSPRWRKPEIHAKVPPTRNAASAMYWAGRGAMPSL